MKKNSKKSLVITLAAIGIISALLLTFVYEWTTPYIQANQAEKQKLAITEVLPTAEKIEEIEKEGQTFFEGYDSAGNRVGVAFSKSGGGYSGVIEIMIGVDLKSQEVNKFSVLTHEETPGLGARITESEFKSNFENKKFGEYKVIKTPPKEELEVQAIAGATISSESVTRIIEAGLDKVITAYGGGN